MIIVQLGANTDSSEMPSHLVKAFLGAFTRLKKYRIFWRIGPNLKLNGVDLDEVPSHINVTTYLPQNDLLGRYLRYFGLVETVTISLLNTGKFLNNRNIIFFENHLRECQVDTKNQLLLDVSGIWSAPSSFGSKIGCGIFFASLA